MGLGDFISGIFGSDSKQNIATPKLNDSSFQVNGSATGAADQRRTYQNQGNTNAQAIYSQGTANQARDYNQGNANASGDYAWANQSAYRTGPQLQTGQIDQSRGAQNAALGLAAGAANGTAPSAANATLIQGLNAAEASQVQAAAGARGPAALAGAQANAAGNIAALQQQTATAAGIQRAQEMATARQQYGDLAGNLRGQDFAQAQAQAGFDAGQRALNDQTTFAYNQLGQNQQQTYAQMAQQNQLATDQLGLQNQLAYQGMGMQTEEDQERLAAQQATLASGNILGAQGQALNQSEANAGRADANASGLINGGIGIASAALGASDYRLKSQIQPETDPNGYGYSPSQIGTPGAPLASPMDRMGLAGMNAAQLGYAPPPAAAPEASPTDQKDVAKQIARDVDSAHGKKGSAYDTGHGLGSALMGAIFGKPQGLSDANVKRDLADLSGALGAGSGAGAATGPYAYAATTRAVDNGPGTVASTSGPGNPRAFSDEATKERVKRESLERGVQLGMKVAGAAAADVVMPGMGYVAGMGLAGAMGRKAAGPGISAQEAARAQATPIPAGSTFVGRQATPGGGTVDSYALPPERAAAPAQMMDQITPYSYNYKEGTPGEDPSRRRYGVMAQDLQKSPMGASVVEETPQGKMIDAAKGVGVAFANEANLHERLKQLENYVGAGALGRGR